MNKDYLNGKLQNLINIRNVYVTIILALTGYLFGTYKNVSGLILFSASFIDIIFIINYFRINNKIDKVLKNMRAL